MGVVREVFKSFENQMTRLREVASVSPPPTASGATAFFSSLDKWMFPDRSTRTLSSVVFPDPSLNLSFPYAEDELLLAAAHCTTGYSNDEIRAMIANLTGLPREVLARPVTALSGGERMLVSLCKASLLARNRGDLIVCSPFFWLDPGHRPLVNGFLDHHDQSGGAGCLMTLEGEEDSDADQSEESPRQLDWVLMMDHSTVVFPAMSFPRETAETRLEFVLPEKRLALRSPTLISGCNGVGKTTFAKVLAGVLRATDKSPEIACQGFSGKARLLMQDTIVQLFAQSPVGHLERVFRHDKARGELARSLFTNMQSECAKALFSVDPGLTVGDSNTPSTVFQAKLALTAERLISKPPLLILDEPGWCLSRTAAQVFVREVVRVAHELGIAIALISHQAEWWKGIVAGQITFSAGNSRDQVLVQVEKKEAMWARAT